MGKDVFYLKASLEFPGECSCLCVFICVQYANTATDRKGAFKGHFKLRQKSDDRTQHHLVVTLKTQKNTRQITCFIQNLFLMHAFNIYLYYIRIRTV